ncbi:MAG: chaperone modulator CbpM [Gammaproteobacteria bacterium]|jgi:chaperone modulatory protein CbpM|nr:chaperone modulator CbpM [Gammaproteobacteria bacterium]MDH5352774.1 chaperone modulator CbpM [Betaproteobacteria bacterium]
MSSNNEAGDVLLAQFLDEDDWLRIDEICARLRVEQQWIVEMVELGALDPRGGLDPAAWVFPRRELPRVLAMTRLVTDLGVNLTGAAIIVQLVEERRRLLSQLAGKG